MRNEFKYNLTVVTPSMQHKKNSGVTGGGKGAECPPEVSDREIFADVSGKRRQGKRGKKLRRKEGKLKKGRWKNENGSRKSNKKSWGPFFCLFFFFFFCFSLLISRQEKNQEKSFCPSEKYACYAPEEEINPCPLDNISEILSCLSTISV